MQIIFLGKKMEVCSAAFELVLERFPEADARIWLGGRGERLPAWDWSSDLLISFLCPRILPERALAQSVLPINFHPAPPEYPGFGCYNFALYEGASEYGATCHRMAPQVDSGEIYAVRRFAVPVDIDLAELQRLTLVAMRELLEEVLEALVSGEGLQRVADWRRPPTCRADFEALRSVPVDATAEEVARRVHAFAHPSYDGAYVRLHGFDFVALPPGQKTR